jgi:hydrogenase expression/formation protein HypC
MCLGIPGQIVESIDEVRQSVLVEVQGQQRRVSAAMLLEQSGELLTKGDWVVVHLGFALSPMDEAEARTVLDGLDELARMYPDDLSV